MDNNDIFRRLRYALDLRDRVLCECFAHAGVTLDVAQVRPFLAQEEDPAFAALSEPLLSAFLDGLIVKRRGKREPAPGTPVAPPVLNNNRVLRALRIALELKDTEIIALMEQANFPISKGELSALFRREDHPNYKPCGDQFLRNFLQGLALRERSRG